MNAEEEEEEEEGALDGDANFISNYLYNDLLAKSRIPT